MQVFVGFVESMLKSIRNLCSFNATLKMNASVVLMHTGMSTSSCALNFTSRQTSAKKYTFALVVNLLKRMCNLIFSIKHL